MLLPSAPEPKQPRSAGTYRTAVCCWCGPAACPLQQSPGRSSQQAHSIRPLLPVWGQTRHMPPCCTARQAHDVSLNLLQEHEHCLQLLRLMLEEWCGLSCPTCHRPLLLLIGSCHRLVRRGAQGFGGPAAAEQFHDAIADARGPGQHGGQAALAVSLAALLQSSGSGVLRVVCESGV